MVEERAHTAPKTRERRVKACAMLWTSLPAFWLKWLLATALAFGMGAVFVGVWVAFWDYAPVVGWVLAGFLLGSAQSLVLRERMRVGGWWIAASVIGCATYGGVFNIVLKTTSQTEGAAVIRASIGILLGLAQWLVLRSQVARSGWWILSSGVGWCAGWISSQFAFEELGFLWAVMTPGLVSGAVTGISLVWILKSSWAGR